MMLDPKGLAAARNAYDKSAFAGAGGVEDAIRAYLYTITPAEVGGLVERLKNERPASMLSVLALHLESATALEAQAADNERLTRELSTERTAHAETRRERDALRAYAHEATKAITNIAGGGSELFGRQIGDLWTADLAYCDKVIRERRPYKVEVWKERRLREAAEAQLAEARKALEQAEQQIDYGQVDAAHQILIRAARRALTGGQEDG